MKRIDSRRLTRNFLNTLNEISLPNFEDMSHDKSHGMSHSELDPDGDGIVSQEDLYKHFDLDGDGKVHTDEYVDHIEYHAENPDTLDAYREDVPCNNSYNTCYNHHNSDHEILKNCITQSGATCMQSGIQALIDVLSAMKNSGII